MSSSANLSPRQYGSMGSKPVFVGLAAVIAVYLILAIAFSQVIPFNKGPDEETNLAYTEFIASKGRLPITYEERELVGKDANWPPLFHFILAQMSNILNVNAEGPPYIKVYWDSFRYQAIDGGGEWYYLYTEDQQWPYYGRILILQIGRWLSIFFGVIALVFVYCIILELLPKQPWLALVAVAMLAFIPMFIFMSSVLNEDTMMAALTALYLWLLIRIVKYPDKLWSYGVIGLALGVSVTTKYTPIILPFEVVIVVAALTWKYSYGWRWWLLRVVIVASTAALASSWWFGWNFWYLNEVEELGLVAGLLRPIFTGGPDVTLARMGYYFSGGQIGLSDLPEGRVPEAFSGWVRNTFLTFWGVFIGGAIPLYPYIYPFVVLVLTITTLGLWQLWRTDPASRTWMYLLVFHISIFFVLPLLRFGLSRRLGETAQGRHILMPAAGAIVALLVWGMAKAVPRRWQLWLFSIVIGGLLSWAGAHLYGLNTFSTSPVPLRTLPQAAEWLSHSINAQFGDTVELVSYDIDPQPTSGLIRLNLAWRALGHINENYQLKITLVDAQGEIVSLWTGYNGHGRLPTLAWDSGDVVFDRLALPLPNLLSGNYTVQVQVLSRVGALPVNYETGDRQISQPRDNSNIRQDEILSLTDISFDQTVTLSPTKNLEIIGGELANPIQIEFDLWQADGPLKTTQMPIYRYPATISVVVSNSKIDGAELVVQLVDPSGQLWPATQSEAGIYTFVIGPRWQSGDYRLQLSLQKSDQVVGQTVTRPLLTVENWWERQFKVPDEIAQPLEANFANQIKLLGYTLPQKQVKAGDAFPVTFYWQAPPNRSPQANFIQFNHLLDSNGKLRGGYDRRPLEYYSTLLWAPGEVVVDGYTVPVNPDAPPGQYYLDVGYYLIVSESSVDLPLVVDGEMTDTHSVTVGPIEVLAP